jgi:hypothetical protein
MTPGRTAAWRALVIFLVIGGGLLIDQAIPVWGQTLMSVGAWAIFVWWLRSSNPHDQIALTTCVLYATAGEIFLSLVWGLYEYRMSNIPLFVPPGHALLFMLGGLAAERVRDWIIWFVPLAATPWVLFLLFTGADTLGGVLFSIFLLCMIFGRARRLYAVMFVLSLAMEIYGTWLGNWTWATTVPWLGLTTVNPPLASGTFYCVLDLMVVATATALSRRRTAAMVPKAAPQG